MNRTVKLALSAAMALVIVAPVFAQENFPDTPENHWAYDALARMKKEGILVGYPDGKYRGSRPATRYEMAVAINAAYVNLKSITDGLDGQIKAIQSKLDSGSGISQSDIDNLKQALKDLQDQVDGMKSYGQDIDDLKKMASQFSDELTKMGANVKDMQDELSSLDKRVTALENRKLPVDIHGDFTAAAIGAYSTSNGFGVTTDGRPEGFGRGSYAGLPVGINRDFTVLHEAAIELDSTNDTGPKFQIVGVAGNLFDSGTQSTTAAGQPFAEGTNDIYLQKFAIMFHESLAGLGFDASVGRIGVKLNEYMFKRAPVSPYLHIERWDNGEWDVDGASVKFGIGKSGGLTVIAARTSDQKTSSNLEFQPMTAGAFNPVYQVGGGRPAGLAIGALAIDQMLGANLNIPLGDKGSVDASYLFLDSNTVTGGANRVSVYGADAKYKFGAITASGGYHKSDLYYNTSKVNNSNDAEYGGMLHYSSNKWGVMGGYREIEPLYAAPGYWGRIGAWWNPTDIKGFQVGGHLDLTSALTLHAMGEFYTGTGKVATGLSTSDKISHYNADLTYKFGKSYDVMLGYERVDWNLASRTGFTGGKPIEQWYNIGFGFDLSDQASLSLLWQISDYDSKGVTGFSFLGQPTAKGGLITTQLTIKI